MEKANRETNKLAQEGKLEVIDKKLEVASPEDLREPVDGTDPEDDGEDDQSVEEELSLREDGGESAVRPRIVQLVSWKYACVLTASGHPANKNETRLARWVRPSRPASAHSFSTLRLNLIGWCLLTGLLALSATAPNFIPSTAIRSVPFIWSRNCVPVAFTAESPPAQGQ